MQEFNRLKSVSAPLWQIQNSREIRGFKITIGLLYKWAGLDSEIT